MPTKHRCTHCDWNTDCPGSPTATAGAIAEAEETLRSARVRRLLAWATLPGAILLTYLTLLVSHPLGLLLTMPLGFAGFAAMVTYDNGMSVTDARAALHRLRSDYVDAMLADGPDGQPGRIA